MSGSKYDMVTILGPTASGKTEVAVNLALKLNGEIISADSRQIYRQMDLGTGKDLHEYQINGIDVPYHLIDIAEAGYQYNVFEFQRDFLKVYHAIKEKGSYPVMCGGSGMYLEAILKGYRLIQVPVNEERRADLQLLSPEALTEILKRYKSINNTSDIENKKRTIRAIEIEEFCVAHPETELSFPPINSLIVGVKYDRDSRRRRITTRLKQRLDNGMIDEVQKLINNGLKPEDLTYYGLEYKYLTLYITGELTYDEMFTGLNTAIHQFAKRQMTWFRKMEREGFEINWLDGYMPVNEKTDKILSWLNP
ncbi:MAG: tRNA (adenosine(37)-N6)-dimethylallyltransferase MiaA [Bacteroidia bacterium]|nr:tRNA (adenosine(37)-N6)-dimethylallyltransferase MiaA [Bacteroidia bacterium]